MGISYYVHHLNDFSGSPSILNDRVICSEADIKIVITNQSLGFLSGEGYLKVVFSYKKHTLYFLRMLSLTSWYFKVFLYLLLVVKRGDSIHFSTLIASPLLLVGKLKKGVQLELAINEVKFQIPMWSFLGLCLANSPVVTKIYLSRYVSNYWRLKGPSRVCYPRLRPIFYEYAVNFKRKDLQIDKSSFDVFTVCSQAPGKGYSMFIEIARLCYSLGLNHIFTLYLSGSRRAFAEKYKTSSLPGNLVVLFDVNDASIFWNHQIFLGLTDPLLWKETFGLTFAEAMISENLVILPSEGAHLEYLQEGVNGFSTQKYDASVILRQLNAIIELRDIVRIRQQARQTILDLDLAGRA
jgi:hypothetical protein